MKLNETFDIGSLPVSEKGGFEPLPDGWYDVTISSCEQRTTKAGNGQYLHLAYTVDGPSHAGRIVFGNLNIRNSNPKAESIGRQQLGEVMRAIGVASLTDTDQLLGGKLSVKLATRKSDEYGDSNDIKGFKARAGSTPPATAAKSAPARATPPWAKK